MDYTVRESFRQQSDWCEKLGSPFDARLRTVLGENIDRATGFGQRILDWPLETLRGDLVPLRCVAPLLPCIGPEGILI
jgi:hypothetical protein